MSARGRFQDNPGLEVETVALARSGRMLVRDLSFTAPAGSFVEVRGANGSGKTTLLRSIAGYVRPSAGRIVFPAIAEPALALHYVGHLNGLKPTASVAAHLRYWAGLFGAQASVTDTAQALGLAAQLELPARVLSQGQARRLALARLLAAPRPIWLLDEPAAGLDEKARATLDKLISDQQAAGGLVIAALHDSLGAPPTQSVRLGA